MKILPEDQRLQSASHSHKNKDDKLKNAWIDTSQWER